MPTPCPPPADAVLPHLPVFLTVRGRLCVLVGGPAAGPKLALLRRTGARIRLVGDAVDPELAAAAAATGAEIIPGPLSAEHLAGACLAIDGSDDAAAAERTVALARAAGVPINVVDRPELCDFILPAILDRSPLVVAVSTGGAAPAMASLIRQELEAAIPHRLGPLVALSGRIRGEVGRRLADPRRRLAFWQRLYRDGTEGAARGEDEQAAAALRLLDRVASQDSTRGSLTRIETGPGGAEDLTLRSLRALRRADLVVHDAGVDPALLDHARRDAPRRRLAPGAALDLAELRRRIDEGHRIVHLALPRAEPRRTITSSALEGGGRDPDEPAQFGAGSAAAGSDTVRSRQITMPNALSSAIRPSLVVSP